jgi:ribonuclease P protein component
MFSKAERLNRAEFSTFFKAGRPYHSPVATIIFTPGSKLRVSAVVGKKVAKLAVGRNKLRRRVYATLRRELGGEARGAVIVILKPKAASLSRADLASAVSALLAQIPHSR